MDRLEEVFNPYKAAKYNEDIQRARLEARQVKSNKCHSKLKGNIETNSHSGKPMRIWTWIRATQLCLRCFGTHNFPALMYWMSHQPKMMNMVIYLQSGATYLSQDFVMFFHASCEGLSGQ